MPEYLLAVALVALTLLTLALIPYLRKRKRKYQENQLRLRQEHQEKELRRISDQQLDHGRRVYNWLSRELRKYEKYDEHRGIHVSKIENNGDLFSIHISRTWDGEFHGWILQLDYDFVRLSYPYLGHIHYGAYGDDILILAESTSPLQRLVIDEVERVVARDLSHV